MRSQAGAAVAVFLLMGQAFADPADWAALAKFAGTYPATGLMKAALVRHEVAVLLGRKQRALLATMVESPPVARVGGDLLAQFCLPHDCGSQSAVLIVDPAGRNMWVGFYDNDGKRYRMAWAGTEDPATIPPEVQKQLARIHDPF